MKGKFLLLTVLMFTFVFTGCGQTQSVTQQSPQQKSEIQSEEISAVSEANGFKLTLVADKGSYTVDEEIKIQAELVYEGERESITIWHGDPYLVFSVTDGGDFNMDGMIMTILTSTQLKRGEVYTAPFVKSGGFSEDDPNADFWREFYQQPELILPVGEYTVTVSGAFSLDEQQSVPSGLKCSLMLNVT